MGRDEPETWGTDGQPLADKPPLTRCGETCKLTTRSSNLKAQHKVLC